MPAALERRPDLTAYEYRVFHQYMKLSAMRPESFSGAGRISLREIDLYLVYYPVDDVYYFIDLMTELDRVHRDGIKASRQN